MRSASSVSGCLLCDVPMADTERLDDIEVRGARADSGAGQLHELREAGAAAAGQPWQAALHEGEGQGAPPRRIAG